MIAHPKSKYDWAFIFLGADIDVTPAERVFNSQLQYVEFSLEDYKHSTKPIKTVKIVETSLALHSERWDGVV